MTAHALKTLLLRRALDLAGLCALAIFLLVRVRGGALLLVDHHEYFTGRDLYKESYVDHFREPHPAFDRVTGDIIGYQLRPENPALPEADLLMFGDSYGNFRYLPCFPERLGQTLGRRVYFRRSYNPVAVLEQEKYAPPGPRLLIYEIGERGIYTAFHNQPPSRLPPGGGRRVEPLFQVLPPGEAERRYTALLQLNRWTHRLYKRLATFKFDHFGYLSPMTPVYHLDPPWLFFKSTVDGSPTSFTYPHSEQEIATICDHIAELGATLRTRYQLELVFMPVPERSALYSRLVLPEAKYNNFLPRIRQGLADRGVSMIDLYPPFRASTNVLFFRSDTHWNEHGIDLALDVALRYLDERGLKPRPPPGPAGPNHRF